MALRAGTQMVIDRWQYYTGKDGLKELHQLLRPSELQSLPTEDQEALLDALPQIGEIKGRQEGGLRIMSAGWHFHIQGKAPRCPYEFVDFFVRCGGYESVVNLVLRLNPCERSVSAKQALKQAHITEVMDLFEALPLLNDAGFGLKDLELVMQRMYRPGVPNASHLSIPGGVKAIGEDARARGLQEIDEEAPGLTIVADRLLLQNREYQGGNIAEFHSVNGALCIGQPKLSPQAAAEGITDYVFIRVPHAADWFDEMCGVPPTDVGCNLPSGKADHALLKFLLMCHRYNIE